MISNFMVIDCFLPQEEIDNMSQIIVKQKKTLLKSSKLLKQIEKHIIQIHIKTLMQHNPKLRAQFKRYFQSRKESILSVKLEEKKHSDDSEEEGHANSAAKLTAAPKVVSTPLGFTPSL